MDSNGNQRKRGSRVAKNSNIEEKSLSLNNEQIETVEVPAIAISPTLEESETVMNAPTAECRRSSRKKIIKFDVRDLLNKNRKTHKIQIEARIDSNAPTTSKASIAGDLETYNLKTSSTAREDMLSKQKTFLEKSAIFRRYSISQEHKPPPPPLPIPPLLGKTNDNQDISLSGNSSTRRLSRTQEFFSNVMVKPKQTTSLIVAQIESNTPCSVIAAKRKSLCKPIAMETKVMCKSESGLSPVVQQKKRGRPAKIKTQTSADILVKNFVQEESAKKKITPEKAKNWKEYKACLAQHSTSRKKVKEVRKMENIPTLQYEYKKDTENVIIEKQNEVKHNYDNPQSDVSRSDDDGNFSGFQINQDDISYDSSVLPKLSLEKDIVIENEIKASNTGPAEDLETKIMDSKEKQPVFKNKPIIVDKIQNCPKVVLDSKVDENAKLNFTKIQNIASNESLTEEIVITKEVRKTETDIKMEENTRSQLVTIQEKNEKVVELHNVQKASGVSQNSEINITLEVNTRKNQSVIKQQENEDVDLEMKISKSTSPDHKEANKSDNNISNQPVRNEFRELSKNVRDTRFYSEEGGMEKILGTKRKSGEFRKKKADTTTVTKSQTIEDSPVIQNLLKIADISTNSSQIMKNCAPYTKTNDIIILNDPMPLTQPSTSSEEIKLFSCPSSLSESENTSEHSSCSSEPFSTTSSSSIKSNKSGDKLKVSVKRMSLPKSPSTSSQTSTSEELNNFNVLKRKPLMVKRSKRPQKKSAEKKTEDIDVCFQIIPNEDHKQEQKFDEKTNAENIELSSEENKAETFYISSKANIKDYKDNSASEIVDSLSNESVNVGYLSAKEKLVKRNSNENISCNTDRETVKPKLERKEITVEKEIKEKDESFSNINNTQQHKLLSNECKEDKKEEKRQLLPTLKNNIEFEKALGSDQSHESESKEKIIGKNPNENSTTRIATANTTTKKEDDNIKELNIQADISDVKETSLKEFFAPSLAIQNAVQTVGSISKEMEMETKTKSLSKSLIKNEQEKVNTTTSIECKIQDDKVIELSKETCAKDIYIQNSSKNKAFQIITSTEGKTLEITQNETIQNSAETAKITLTVNKTAKEGFSTDYFRFQDKQLAEDKVKKISMKEHFTQSSKDASDQEKKLLPVKMQVRTAGTTQDKSNQKNIQEENLKFEEKDGTTTPQLINVKTLGSSQGKTKVVGDKSTVIDKNAEAKQLEQMKTKSPTSKSNKEMSTKKLSNQLEYQVHSPIPTEDSVKNELKNSKTYVTNISHTPKEELLTTDEFSAIRIMPTTNKSNQENSLTKETTILEDDPNDKFLKATLKHKDTKSSNSKETATEATIYCINLPELTNNSSSENSENFTKEFSSPCSSTKIITQMPEENLKSFAVVNLTSDQYSNKQVTQSSSEVSRKVSLPSALIKTIPLKHFQPLNTCVEENSSDGLQEMDKTRDTEENTITTSALITEQENNSLKNKDQISVNKEAVTKRRGRKPRCKNHNSSEIDSETDSINGKNTPIDEITHGILKSETKEQETNEIQIQTILETDKNFCEMKKKFEDANDSEESVNLQENSQANLLSSQIKNVSIETNTLLDILRTVQSNTEAALKASKSPTNILITEDPYYTCEIQQEPKTISPIWFDTQSKLTIKKIHLSPARSDTASPLTFKKVIPSPTRSNSSSPLTLKKVTRRYERRSRRGEDSAHKTLEETFAEIAAQSSKAVLAAKEFDIDEEQTAVEKAQHDIDDTNTELNIENTQTGENFVELEKLTDLEGMPSNVDKNIAETLLNVPQYEEKPLIVSKEEGDNPIENVIEVETAKVTPARKGRKPKNKSSEVLISVAKETLVKKNTSKTKEETTIAQRLIKDTKMEAETVNINKTETIEEDQANKSQEIIESIETTQTGNLTKSKSPLPLLNNPQMDLKEFPNSPQTPIEGSLEASKEVIEKRSGKKSTKKRDTKALIEENSLFLNVITCIDKEDETRSPKQPTKKLDSSLGKSETKSVGKKKPKIIKNEEENLLGIPKEETKIKIGATISPPSKRGRKPKNQQPETVQQMSCSKKRNKKDTCIKSEEEDINVVKMKLMESGSESLITSGEKSLDEKLEKKKRQKKLKEAFEAALADDIEKNKEAHQTETQSPTGSISFGLTLINNSPPPERSLTISNEEINETIRLTCITPAETEEDPDPLKDIEKFIADGVNLLKKDYKLNEDSVDDVIQSTPSKTTEVVEESVKNSCEVIKLILNTFETPVDTPINTPSVTPPPKSPTSTELSTPDENSGVRRSHRIKLITKTPKALVGRGLVRDKERFSIKDDVETKSHYSLDDHLTDLAEVEAKNAKFLKEMEERLSNFQVIKENEYLCERVISREARKMICDCFLTHGEEERGELGCGEDCLNRLLMIECGPECNVKERCTNKRFQKLLCSPCRVFRTEKKGFGIMADIEILPGEFIMEYVGEVIDTEEFEKRRIMYSQDKNRHYYFMALRSDAIIDATIKGNISRFINHSCDPNAETQKWTVNGELRIGFFSRKSIMPGEEITFNYQYQRYGREAQRCYCESTNCRGWIGQEPTSDEGEQMDADEEDDETDDEDDEGEEADTSNLLVQDDDEDSDASVTDPEEVQKQLEMAAAKAEVELAPLQLLDEKAKHSSCIAVGESKSIQDINKLDNEEDSKSKFKKLLSKMAEKVAAKQKQNKREQKLQRKKKSKETSSDLTNKLRFLEDPDIEDEVEFLKECGLKNQSDTLRLSRLMVRAKLVQTRLNLLEILRKGDFPCRRLFLDYHGLRLLHGWMSEDAGNMQIRLSLLKTLETLPIANKTVLTDSKVMQVVRSWCGNSTNLSPNEDSSSSNSNSQDVLVQGSASFEEGSEMAELQKLALKLITAWEGLPEIFRIPKKERIEQMKEHEREADRQYAANAETQEHTTATDRYRRDRFGRGLNTLNNSNRFVKPNNGNPHRTTNTTPENIKNLSKAQRREMFAAKVARDEAEKRLAEERREFETKCRFFGLDPKKTRSQDIPFCVNPATGQWFSIERKPITTPPSYAHVQVPVKPKSTDPNDYQLPAVCSSLPSHWKYAITTQGKIYYYHIKHRIPQWEPPSTAQLQNYELENREEYSEVELTTTAGEDSSDDDDDILIGMDSSKLKAYIDRKVEMRRQKRYQRLVDERSISPRREEDRVYNQIEVRKYKENKEKIRKRKEDIRRKRAESLRQTSLNMCTLGNITDTNANANSNASKLSSQSVEELGVLPIQDYLLSSDEEVDIKAEVNSPLIDKIVEGDKIVDELDALTTKRQLKRPLPPHRDLNEPSTSSSIPSALVTTTLVAKSEYKKRKLEKKEKRKPKEQDAKYRKNKEKFRCEIAGIIVHHLKPYLKDTCTLGRIQSNEDFNHLARKLTHFVMIKELKYCESVGQTLVVTESVKSKSREFIKKYMAKYGDVYVKPTNDPDFKDIPFTL